MEELRSRFRSCTVVVLAALAASPAVAAPNSGTTSIAGKKKPAKREEEFKKPSVACSTPSPQAKKRFERAIELFNEGNYDASLLEFRRAYQLCPSYKILYNVALVNVQVNDYAEALKYFSRYLTEGGSDVPELRREDVEKRIEQMKNRVALVTIKSNVPTASVSVDDLEIASSVPNKPISVNEGRRKITLSAKGRLPASKVVELAGRDSVTLHFDLRKPNDLGGLMLPPQRRFPWEAWVGTGILAAGTAVTGVLALNAHSDLNNAKNSFDPTVSPDTKRQQLNDAQAKQKNFALVTDILGGATVVLAGVATYLTLKKPSQEGVGTHTSLRIGVSPQGASVSGVF